MYVKTHIGHLIIYLIIFFLLLHYLLVTMLRYRDKSIPKFAVTVDLPTPPFPDKTKTCKSDINNGTEISSCNFVIFIINDILSIRNWGGFIIVADQYLLCKELIQQTYCLSVRKFQTSAPKINRRTVRTVRTDICTYRQTDKVISRGRFVPWKAVHEPTRFGARLCSPLIAMHIVYQPCVWHLQAAQQWQQCQDQPELVRLLHRSFG